MSLKKKKDPMQPPGGLRVAADAPHLVSLGGGRLSTAVTIHHLPIGHTTIGSSTECRVILNGTAVLPHHCTLHRSEAGHVTLLPERDSRILIDGKKCDATTNLTQGAMLTIGKSNYLRFNNPAEAQLLKSSIGSNDRISMPQIDFNQESSASSSVSSSPSTSPGGGGGDGSGIGSNGTGKSDDILKNLHDILNSQNYNNHRNHEASILEKMTKNDLTASNNINHFHSPKVFAADSITVNTPAKDVLGSKFNNFTKNLTQIFTKNDNTKNPTQLPPLPSHRNNMNVVQMSASSSSSLPPSTTAMGQTANDQFGVLAKVNNVSSHPVAATASVSASPKVQQFSPCYDRYPKPGSYGSLQVFPMNGVNSEINNTASPEKHGSPTHIGNGSSGGLTELHRQRAQIERMQEQEISKIEHDRLEEILKMCADFERQNQNVQSSPIVQNRIKTNGSLPREKKPIEHSEPNLFFPQTPTNASSSSTTLLHEHSVKTNSGYENVQILSGRRIDIATGNTATMSPNRYPRSDTVSPSNSINGYENVVGPVVAKKSYTPQSPRTKIKTCVSPKKEMAKRSEYDMLVQSFEDKLRLEIQLLRENKNFDTLVGGEQQKQQQQPNAVAAPEQIYGTLEKRNKNINNLTLNIKTDARSGRTNIESMKTERKQVLMAVRDLKTQIADLQRQEEEVLRELDMEKALVMAELISERTHLEKLEWNISSLQSTFHRMEAQRNANRIMQETQQTRLKASIDVKQSQVNGLEDRMHDGRTDENGVRQTLSATVESLENETKTLEDLEFQYLEEETEWLAYREEVHNGLRTLTKSRDEKQAHIASLEAQSIDDQQTASTDTRSIEKDLWRLLNDLEKRREQLKQIDRNIFDISGQQNSASGSEDEETLPQKQPTTTMTRRDIMSQSLFGSQEILTSRQPDADIMSKSVNENMFFQHNIETLSPFTSTPKRAATQQRLRSDKNHSTSIIDDADNNNDYDDSSLSRLSVRQHPTADTANGCSDAMTKLKYNLSPPFQHKLPKDAVKQAAAMRTQSAIETSYAVQQANLNLSIESDDFEVNPLEKRVPSQDDIDRISKVTLDAPISTQGASDKVIESIKEIERNRQLLLAQQGSHVIEHERQKMNELKKKSHDEARAQYLHLQSISSESESYVSKDRSLENVNEQQVALNNDNKFSPHRQFTSSPQRHSHPDFERPTRPLSDANSELSYDALSEKPFKSSSDISRQSSNRLYDTSDERNGDGVGSGGVGLSSNNNNIVGNGGQMYAKHHHQQQLQRNSQLSAQSDSNSESGGGGGGDVSSGRMVSGNKRNLPKHQRPLTRYLPIMSLDLDLRQHIESAGHQVTLCPHVLIDSVSCRGYLHKLGATFHGWSRRWFVLDRQKMALIYYADKSERKPRGGAYFSTIDEVYLDHMNMSKSGRPHCTFIVKTKKRSYHLQAASDAAARIWIDAIITGAQGNIDY